MWRRAQDRGRLGRKIGIRGKLKVFFLGLVIIGVMISLNWWLLGNYLNTNYFVWYLKNGSLIAIAVSFLAFAWKDLEKRKDLLSLHPLAYISGCMGLLGIFVFSLGDYMEGTQRRRVAERSAFILRELEDNRAKLIELAAQIRKETIKFQGIMKNKGTEQEAREISESIDKKKREWAATTAIIRALGQAARKRIKFYGLDSAELSWLWDGLVTLPVFLLIFILTLAWLVVIAPLNYLITLITGAMARQQLRGSSIRTIVEEKGKETIITSQPVEQGIPTGAVDVSFARRPFAMTQAVTALVLFICNQIYGFFV